MKRPVERALSAWAGVVATSLVLAAVLPLEYAWTVSEFFRNGETYYTDRGWHSELPDGRTLDYLTGVSSTHDYRVDLVTDGLPSTTDLPLTLGTPGWIEVQPQEIGWTGGRGKLTVYFDPMSIQAEIRPMTSVSSPTYWVEYSLDQDFGASASIALDDSSSWNLVLDPTQTWYFRFSAWDETLKQRRAPSPVLTIGP